MNNAQGNGDFGIYVWSNEGRPLEPLHIHIAKEPTPNGTKVWLLSNGKTKVVHNKSQIPPKDLKRLLSVIEEFSDDIAVKWKEHFKVEQVRYKDQYDREGSR